MTTTSNPLLVVTVLALVIAPSSSYAGDVHSLSANAAVQTDYRFRGISQSSEDIAVSGAFDYSYNPIGIYIGVWASSIEFNGCGATCTDTASTEVDFYAGIAGELNNGLGWDLGGIYYAYPSQNEEAAVEFDFVEIYGKVSYAFANAPLEPTLSAGLSYSPDFFGDAGDAYYFSTRLDLSLPSNFSVGAELGWQDVQNSGDYVHWRVGLGYTFKALSLDLSYHDADNDCALVGGSANLCDETLIFTVSSSFDIL